MVANFWMTKSPKKVNSHCFKLNLSFQFHLICQVLANFSRVESERTVFKLRKRKEIFCVVFTYSIRQAREISKFQVAVVQRWQRNVQKSMMHVESCCFVNINLLLFNGSRCRRRRRCLNSPLL